MELESSRRFSQRVGEIHDLNLILLRRDCAVEIGCQLVNIFAIPDSRSSDSEPEIMELYSAKQSDKSNLGCSARQIHTVAIGCIIWCAIDSINITSETEESIDGDTAYSDFVRFGFSIKSSQATRKWR
jgi:hypothetical protein